jgi:hypothetical protein
LAIQVRVKVETFRKEREESIFKTASIKKFYAYAKVKIHLSDSLGPIRDVSGIVHLSSEDKANALNNFFHSVFTQDDGNLPNFGLRTNKSMSLPLFEVNDVRRALTSMKNSNTSGPDDCPPCFLKLFPELSFPLTTLYNLSMQQCSVPSA